MFGLGDAISLGHARRFGFIGPAPFGRQRFGVGAFLTGGGFSGDPGRRGPGDLLCGRRAKRGVAGLVTDGVMRDMAGVIGTGLPVWCQGTAAPASVAALTFINWQEPIGCGGVAVFPDDLIMVDDDGAVVIPKALIEEVAAVAAEQEQLEEWIMGEVNGGAALPGLYPPNAENKARYEAWKASR